MEFTSLGLTEHNGQEDWSISSTLKQTRYCYYCHYILDCRQTHRRPKSPLINRMMNDRVLNAWPTVNQTSPQLIDISHGMLIDPPHYHCCIPQRWSLRLSEAGGLVPFVYLFILKSSTEGPEGHLHCQRNTKYTHTKTYKKQT